MSKDLTWLFNMQAPASQAGSPSNVAVLCKMGFIKWAVQVVWNTLKQKETLLYNEFSSTEMCYSAYQVFV